MVRTLHFHGQGQAYDFWSGKWGHTSHVGWPKSKIKKIVTLIEARNRIETAKGRGMGKWR